MLTAPPPLAVSSLDLPLRLPKAELHVHLDGSLRPETMVELARDQGVELPSTDPRSLAAYMLAEDVRDLEEYLERFALTVAVLQTEEALERTAYEMVLDHAAENVRYVEIRYAPVLNTEGGLSMEAVVEASIRGLERGCAETGVTGGIILCALRHLDPRISIETAELAAGFRGRGVVAFDLAAGEAGNPVARHAQAFEIAARAGLGRTVHAGEAWGPESIRQALVEGRAQRIGHGTRLREDAHLEAMVRDQRIPLEICLTSNVQTRVSPTFADHPVRRYFDLDIPVSLCTDNRLMSGTTLTLEYERAREHLGFTDRELARMARRGFEAAFLPWPEKTALLEEVDREMAALLGSGSNAPG